MIEIVTRGADRKYKTECDECYTIFTYTRSDIITNHYPSAIFKNDIHVDEIECPECKYLICHDNENEV